MRLYGWWCEHCSSLRQYSDKPDDDGKHSECPTTFAFPLDEEYIKIDDLEKVIEEEIAYTKKKICDAVNGIRPKGTVYMAHEEIKNDLIDEVINLIRRYKKE